MSKYGVEGRKKLWYPARNVSGETIPAFSMVKVTGEEAVENETVLQIDQPTVYGGQPSIWANHRQDIPDQGIGYISCDWPLHVLYDSADTPAHGNIWGPKNGSWKLNKSVVGFEVIGDPNTTLTTVLVRPFPTYGLRGKLDADLNGGDIATLSVTVNRSHAITGVTTGGAGSASFDVSGDITGRFVTGDKIRVEDSTGNDGIYKVASAAFSVDTTTIDVQEAVSDATVDGDLYIWEDLGDNITVVEVVGTESPIGSGTIVWCNWSQTAGRWVVVAAEC